MAELGPGVQLLCKWRDGKARDAEIIEKRAKADQPDAFEYYVHYIGCKGNCRVCSRGARGSFFVQPAPPRTQSRLTGRTPQGTSVWMSGCRRCSRRRRRRVCACVAQHASRRTGWMRPRPRR